MLLATDNSLFLLVDVQENNINSIHQHEQIIANCKDLSQIANAFNVPTLASEHKPDTNGPLLSKLAKSIPEQCRFSKQEFSCLAAMSSKLLNYQQIVIAGIETHLCVLQTALELLDHHKQVFVVADATDSRFAEDKLIALQRMQQLGVQVVSKQMVLFEWARSSNHPEFIKVSEQMLK